MEYGVWSMEHGARSSELGARGLEHPLVELGRFCVRDQGLALDLLLLSFHQFIARTISWGSSSILLYSGTVRNWGRIIVMIRKVGIVPLLQS